MKTKRITKVLMSMAMAIMLSLGLTTTAFAVSTGTEAADATAAITKVLEAPAGTKLSANMPFTFNFAQDTAIATDANNQGITVATDRVTIPTATATFIPTMAGTTATDKTTFEIQTPNFLQNVTFPKAGIYVYNVTENGGSYTAASGETVTYSREAYRMYVYVANKTAPQTGTYIMAVGVVKTTNADGTAANVDAAGKVDPTPGGSTDGTVDANHSEFKFTNSYIKTKPAPITPADPTTYGLDVTKTVTGALGDQTRDFNFTITVNKPNFPAATATSFNAMKVSANGTTNLTIPYGSAYNFTLKHNERLILGDAYIGSTYTVSETVVTGYGASYAITTADTAVPSVTGLSAANQVIGDGANSAAFTNAFQDVTPTGIIMNNLPFFLLILAACGVLIISVIVKSKKRERFSA